jgi:hypothetical protein
VGAYGSQDASLDASVMIVGRALKRGKKKDSIIFNLLAVGTTADRQIPVLI